MLQIHQKEAAMTGCPICGSHDAFTTPVLPGKDYPIHICRTCQHGWRLALDKEQLNSMYNEKQDFRTVPPKWGFQAWKIGRHYRNLCPGKGRILEIGCNNGHFLKSFDEGWDKYGVDLSRDAIETAGKHIKGTFHAGFVEDLIPVLAERQYEIIVAHEVIEHLTSPETLLAQLASLLSDNGILCISTPDRTSLHAQADGLNWSLMHSVGHLHFFSNSSLERLVLDSGLVPINRCWRGARGPVMFGWNPPRNRLISKLRQAFYEYSKDLRNPIASHLYMITRKIAER